MPNPFNYNVVSGVDSDLLEHELLTDEEGRLIVSIYNNMTEKAFGGEIICTSGATIAGSGKAFEFFAPQTEIILKVEVDFDLTITSGNSIRVDKWNQLPNIGLTGKVEGETIAHTGGNITITADSTYRWISFFAKNPANSNYYDGLYFVVNGNVVTLLNF